MSCMSMVEHFRTYRVLEVFLYLLFEELENILLTFIPGFSYTSFQQFPKIHTRTFFIESCQETQAL